MVRLVEVGDLASLVLGQHMIKKNLNKEIFALIPP